ncbi:adenylate/guanylate cyclase domain-containing protein [Moorena sp. SIO3A2]|uniref:adenylate/guanylate cyclase domain-containing protein n=1 Tax=Moorena sp. SIO3A2 TaxID=2607841 RepID=UPI00257EA258|nr:adenylate/guanylate cyclase domain-containing protein [Moorena sp. SIO3A2]
MGLLNNFSIRSKLIFMLLALSTCSLFVTAYIGYRSGKSHLSKTVSNQLTSLRASKADQIESYFEDIRHQTQTLSENLMVVEAMQEFKTAYNQLQQSRTPTDTPTDLEDTLKEYYRKEFLTKLAETSDGKPVLESYLPETSAARYLQYYYIATNPNPAGEKHLLDDPEDKSEYSSIHTRYHPIFRNIVEKFAYQDILLIDPQTGEIVYSVFKETDFGTNLTTGPYSDSNLAFALGDLRKAKGKDYVQIFDFDSYRPSFGAPVAFIAAPIYDGSKFIGVLAFQLPVNQINNVMTGYRKWKSNGLGDTGEIYLVGEDYLMRSVSRFLIQDPTAYSKALREQGVKEQILKRIEQFGTSILQQPVKTEAVKAALAGQEGTQIINDYRGIEVLSSYAPLNIDGLEWVILSEMDLAEAYAPVYAFQKRVLVSAALIILLITLLAMVLAHLFVQPVRALIASARKVTDGEVDAVVNINSEDEFGELAESFNQMVGSLRTQTKLVEQKNRENEKLLTSVFPDSVAKRLKRGETNIAESVSNVTVLFCDIAGFGKLSRSMDTHEVIAILNDLVSLFDQATAKYGIEKIKTIGDNYMAVCGLSILHIDHQKRAVDFALEMLALTHRFSHERGFDIDLEIGIHSGDIVAGIVGREKVVYDVWGDTVNVANKLMFDCPRGAILVSQNVYNSLHDIYDFEQAEDITPNGKNQQKAWLLKTAQELVASTV